MIILDTKYFILLYVIKIFKSQTLNLNPSYECLQMKNGCPVFPEG